MADKSKAERNIAAEIRDRQLRGLRKLARIRDAIYKFRDEDPDVFSSCSHIDSAILLLDETLKDIREDYDAWKKKAKVRP